MNWKRMTVCGLIALLAVPVLGRAQEPPPPPPPAGVPAPQPGRPHAGQARWGERGRPGGVPGMPGARGGALEEMMERFRNRLQQEDPETYNRLMALRESNPEAFRDEMRELIASRMRGDAGPLAPVNAEEVKCVDLARQVREAKTPEAAAAVKAELKKAIEAAFDKRLEQQQQMLQEFQKRMAAIQEQVKERQANKAKICELRLEELTRDESLRW